MVWALSNELFLRNSSFMENIIIRKALADDLDALYRFEQGVINAERPFDRTLKETHINYYDLRNMLEAPHTELVVAVLDGELIGSGYARIEDAKPYLKHETHAYLGFMFVHPHHRGKGVNNLIIQYLKNWAASKQVFELRLDVYVQNVSAIKAYEKVGFIPHMLEMRLAVNEAGS